MDCTCTANVYAMIFSEEAASVSRSGAPSFCSRKNWNRDEKDVSERRARKNSTVCLGNLRANFITGSLNGLPSCVHVCVRVYGDLNNRDFSKTPNTPGWNGSRDCARSRGIAAILRANYAPFLRAKSPFDAKTR